MTVTRVVIDDLRTHADGGIHLRSSRTALEWFASHPNEAILELWLDHDLGGDDTTMPVVNLLEELCFNGTPRDIGTIYVHTANPVGGDQIMSSRLLRENYRLLRVGLSNFLP